ncbi:hypothetical protein N8I77_000497 [Diaporthe amygdali]|uniref:Uncharacterized protein n=1 Tax=Phomopsis amygdali TaxID=1214568 RepID=A0AAD9W766_PHOAM|nr:hypothetical protein N8I77_000497 [Diaporthe amygdali]
MKPYFPTLAYATEPEGWDATRVLQIENPTTGRWSCPTITKRNRRCENVVSQERSQKVNRMLNSIAVEDAGAIAKDHNRELTVLAEAMFCPLHSRATDSKEKFKDVVAQWKNNIKTSIRLQVPPPALNVNRTIPAVEYQPTKAPSGLRDRPFNAYPEQTATIPQEQRKNQTATLGVSLTPQSPPPRYGTPSYGAIIDQAALGDFLEAFQSLTLQNQQLKEENQKLRDLNAELVEEANLATKELKRTRKELEAAEKVHELLEEQVDEQFDEINTLSEREAAHLETIAALRETIQMNSKAYRKPKSVWATG